MRIGVASIALEANTFNPAPTTLRDFHACLYCVGEELWQLRDAHHELGGFLTGLTEQGAEVVPLLAAGAAPGGTVTAETFAELRRHLREQIAAAGPFDGLLLAPHGAMVAENIPDADGFWLEEVREQVGTQIPIIATIDPHGNLSPRMVAATDAIIAYKTNPHIDQRERGLEAARLITRAVRGEIRPTQAACFPPIAIEIERQYSNEAAYAELLRRARQVQTMDSVLSTSVVLGFPYADVPEMGSATLVITDNNRNLAQSLANQLGSEIWQRRAELKSDLVSVESAVSQAQSESGTTCLLDMGDNVGGGSPGDSTILLEEIRRQNAGPALAVIIDADVAAQASSAGLGSTLTLSIGGKLPATTGSPIQGLFTVKSISDGQFTESQPRHGGQQEFKQGLSAVLTDGNLTIVVISERCPPFSLGQVTHLGVDPTAFRLIVAKGVHAPVAAYSPVCQRFIRVSTPGVTAADMAKFSYHQRRQPLFPLEQNIEWSPE